MLFIVALKNGWLIIYVLLLCLSTGQTARACAPWLPGVEGPSGGGDTGHTQWLWHEYRSSAITAIYLPASLKDTALKAGRPAPYFSLQAHNWNLEKEPFYCAVPFCSLRVVPQSSPPHSLSGNPILRKKGSNRPGP